jgi:SNF family Na+-dependent transporter
MAKQREEWGSKLGVILAVAGSAIGLGNFLRFPVKAALYGGGAFLIPYFVAFLLLGVPLAWMEWSMGRFGGRHGHGTGPGILDVMVRRPWAKYAGSIGIFGPMLIGFYYIYIESWLLGFTWYSFTGELMAAVQAGKVGELFGSFITLERTLGVGPDWLAAVPVALLFFVITFLLNFGVLWLGVRRGIERLNELAVPLLLGMGLILLARVLTLPDIGRGLAFMWNPDFSRLLEPRVWLEASGQIFFTLSVGIGVILTYASYVKRNQDIALSSLTACGANEFAEVILGGTIVIPMAIVVFGAANVEEIAKMGTFGLGFQTMPMVFGELPLGAVFQGIWFGMLFVAGLTSSISILQPSLTFLEDELAFSRRAAVGTAAGFQLAAGLVAVFGLTAGAVDEMDFWGGTFLLVLFGTMEAVVFSWIFGVDKGLAELNEGSHLRLPKIMRFVFKYVTPAYLLLVLGAWMYTDGWATMTLANIRRDEMVSFMGYAMSKVEFIWGVRLFLLVVFLMVNGAIWWAWRNRRLVREESLARALNDLEQGGAR